MPTEKVEKILENYQVEEPVSVIPSGIELSAFQVRLTKEEKQR